MQQVALFMPFKCQSDFSGIWMLYVLDRIVSIYWVHVLSNDNFRTFQSYQLPLRLDPTIVINWHNVYNQQHHGTFKIVIVTISSLNLWFCDTWKNIAQLMPSSFKTMYSKTNTCLNRNIFSVLFSLIMTLRI